MFPLAICSPENAQVSNAQKFLLRLTGLLFFEYKAKAISLLI
jgi:hypothetical protein